jgi:hypothetical protein
MQHTGAFTGRPARKSGTFCFKRDSALRLVLAFVAMLTLGIGAPFAAAAQTSPTASPVAAGDSLPSAIAWLVAQQDASGGFIGFSGEPDAGTTIDAVLALAAAGETDSDAMTRATDYLVANGAAFAEQGGGYAAKLVMAMVAAGQDPANLGGINLIEMLTLDAGSDFCGGEVYDHAVCALGLVAAGQTVPEEWLSTLRSYQIENGGWAFDGSREVPMADSNTTAIVVQALIAAGTTPNQEPIAQALSYLTSVMAPDGGFAYAVAEPLIADANSTGIVIQALIAAGEDPSSANWGNATAALTAFQNESGAFRYMNDVPDDNLFATLQAIPALAGQPFPILTS